MHKLILCDMDGVFADFVAGFYALATREHPEMIPHLPKPNSLTHFYVDDHIEDAAMKVLATELVNHPELFAMIPPIPGAVEGVKDLIEKAKTVDFDVMICTAPHKENKHSYIAKAIWIEKHFGRDMLNKTLIVRDKTVVSATLLVDDKPDPLGDHKRIWEHVVMDQSYNRHVNALRMKDWSPESVDWLINVATFRHSMYEAHRNA